MQVYIFQLELLHFVKLAKVGGVFGQPFRDIRQDVKTFHMLSKSLDTIMRGLSSADYKRPVAGLQQQQFASGLFQNLSQIGLEFSTADEMSVFRTGLRSGIPFPRAS